MLSKIDEAAMPWALIKGLSDHALPVSCMAGDSRITQSPGAFDPAVLVGLALAPVWQSLQLAPTDAVPTVAAPAPSPVARVMAQRAVSVATTAQKMVSRHKKHRRLKPELTASPPVSDPSLKLRSSPDILVAAAQPVSLVSSRARVGATLKVVHG